jgi:Uncharacterized protein conserved in bacteria (DUF2213)
MRFYSSEQLGPSQSQLPSGSLLCQSVVIGRTGPQLYHSSEISADIGTDGMIYVDRDENEVFDERAIASFEGAPVTMRHPGGPVDPSNWNELAVGHAQNLRRLGDTLVADLLIHDKRGIDAIRNRGWRSVSCGYNADYEQTAGGGLRQCNIVGNHIAILSPDQEPRCGSMCMIGDHAANRRTTMSGLQMADTRKITRATITRDLAETKRMLNDALRLARKQRKQATHDQDLSVGTNPAWEGQQWTRSGTSVVSEPTVGGRRIVRLPGDATSYAIQADDVGCWVIEIGDLSGFNNGQTGIPSGKSAGMPASTGDRALDRHRRIQMQRDAGAAFASRFNQRQRAKWGG